MMEQRDYHFYACTGIVWATGDTVVEALHKAQRATKNETGKSTLEGYHYILFKVPLPSDAHYEIRAYTPQVEGVEMIDNGVFLD